MNECQTKPLLPNYSGCLVENPICNHAVRFGFSYICEHPNHKEFVVTETPDYEPNAHYHTLRESRRQEYISKIKGYIENL